MPPRISPALFAVALAALVVAGCQPGGEPMTTPEPQLHTTKAFSPEELNAPLKSQSRAKGAQVAAPPVR